MAKKKTEKLEQANIKASNKSRCSVTLSDQDIELATKSYAIKHKHISFNLNDYVRECIYIDAENFGIDQSIDTTYGETINGIKTLNRSLQNFVCMMNNLLSTQQEKDLKQYTQPATMPEELSPSDPLVAKAIKDLDSLTIN